MNYIALKDGEFDPEGREKNLQPHLDKVYEDQHLDHFVLGRMAYKGCRRTANQGISCQIQQICY